MSLAIWVVGVACHVHKTKSYDKHKAIMNATWHKSLRESASPRNSEIEKMQDKKTPEVVMKACGELLSLLSHPF